MSYERWDDEIARGGWGTGGNRREIMADWKTDRAQWRSALKEARSEVERLKEKIRKLKQNKSDQERKSPASDGSI